MDGKRPLQWIAEQADKYSGADLHDHMAQPWNDATPTCVLMSQERQLQLFEVACALQVVMTVVVGVLCYVATPKNPKEHAAAKRVRSLSNAAVKPEALYAFGCCAGQRACILVHFGAPAPSLHCTACTGD